MLRPRQSQPPALAATFCTTLDRQRACDVNVRRAECMRVYASPTRLPQHPPPTLSTAMFVFVCAMLNASSRCSDAHGIGRPGRTGDAGRHGATPVRTPLLHRPTQHAAQHSQHAHRRANLFRAATEPRPSRPRAHVAAHARSRSGKPCRHRKFGREPRGTRKSGFDGIAVASCRGRGRPGRVTIERHQVVPLPHV